MDFAQEFKELQREIRELKTATPGSGGGQTPNDGVLTLQQNGTTIQTFSANQSSNATADFDIHGGVMTADNLSPTSDSVTDWTAFFPASGTYITFYKTAGCFSNQPSQYGFLVTRIHYYPSNSVEISQSWNTTTGTTSPSLVRSGDSVGWHNSTGKFSQSALHTEWNIAPTSDTASAWRSFFPIDGVYTTFYSAHMFNAQPQNWGIMTTEISKHPSDTGFEIYQKWHSQSTGFDYYRAGNTDGWFGSASNAGNFRTIRDGSVQIGTNDIANLAITNAKIANNTISSGKINWSSVGTISVTAASGFSITYNDSFYFGDLRFFSLKIYGSTQAGSRVNVATVASGYRPPHELALMASTGNNQSCNCFLRSAGTIAVQTSGAVTNNDIRIIGFFNA